MKADCLTPEEAAFAEEHHDLVYKVIRLMRLPENKYYDVAVFVYLEAVMYTFRKGAVNFEGLAVHCMKAKIINELRASYSEKRRGNREAYSLDMPCGPEVGLTLCDITPDRTQKTAQTVEDRDLIARIMDAATKKEQETVGLYLAGYSEPSIAKFQNVGVRSIHERMRLFRKKARRIRDGKSENEILTEIYKFRRTWWDAHGKEVNEKRKAKRVDAAKREGEA